jgi:hypothetical protein
MAPLRPAREALVQILYDFLEDYKAASMTSKLDAVKRAVDAIAERDRASRPPGADVDEAAAILRGVSEVAACSEIEGEDDCDGCRARRWLADYDASRPPGELAALREEE